MCSMWKGFNLWMYLYHLSSRIAALQALKGKVIKALESLYHPNCFVCYRCNASLTGTLINRLVYIRYNDPLESFFEHLGNVVCAGCKHELIRVQVQQAMYDHKHIEMNAFLKWSLEPTQILCCLEQQRMSLSQRYANLNPDPKTVESHSALRTLLSSQFDLEIYYKFYARYTFSKQAFFSAFVWYVC